MGSIKNYLELIFRMCYFNISILEDLFTYLLIRFLRIKDSDAIRSLKLKILNNRYEGFLNPKTLSNLQRLYLSRHNYEKILISFQIFRLRKRSFWMIISSLIRDRDE